MNEINESVRKKNTYTEAFREQALQKVGMRGGRTIERVADELNMNPQTLKTWLKVQRRKTPVEQSRKPRRPSERSLKERLELVLSSHGLQGEALQSFCRGHGLFPEHLQRWQEDFAAGVSPARQERAELRALKEENQSLQRELRRKEKALAEAAALLVLQKKYQTLWEGKDA
jgi:transposase-like protein